MTYVSVCVHNMHICTRVLLCVRCVVSPLLCMRWVCCMLCACDSINVCVCARARMCVHTESECVSYFFSPRTLVRDGFPPALLPRRGCHGRLVLTDTTARGILWFDPCACQTAQRLTQTCQIRVITDKQPHGNIPCPCAPAAGPSDGMAGSLSRLSAARATSTSGGGSPSGSGGGG